MSGDEGRSPDGEKLPPEELARQREDKALRARLDRLSESLEARQKASRKREQDARTVEVPGGATGKALSLGFRILAEFVAGVIAGGAIGWGLDKVLSTSPVFILIFGMLGTAAGFWNVYRIAMMPTGVRADKEDGK